MNFSEKETFKKAFWQYCIDHSKCQPNGYLGIQFYVKDFNDLQRRITARKANYEVYNMEEKEKKREKIEKEWKDVYAYYTWSKAHNKEYGNKIRQLENGRWSERLLLYFYKEIKKILFNN